MPRIFQCPRCAEEDRLSGARSDAGIQLTCDECAFTWPRDETPRCATCGGANVRIVNRAVLSHGRGNITSQTGNVETLACPQCDADVLEQYTDRGHPLPDGYMTAAVERRAGAASGTGHVAPGEDLDGERAYLEAVLAARGGTDGTPAPFFGRVDAAPSSSTVYVGRDGVHDADGTPLVMDWRSAEARLFYRPPTGDEQRVTRRRRYTFDGDELVRFTDDDVPGEVPLRDVVTTLRPEQDELIRTDPQVSLLVQGTKGAGKTAVGLHRLAWLIHQEPSLVHHALVVGHTPDSEAAGALAALGAGQVPLTTTAGLLGQDYGAAPGSELPADPPETEQIKSDPRMSEVLRRAVWDTVGQDVDDITYAAGSGRYRLTADQVRQAAYELRMLDKGYDAGRKALPRRLAHLLLGQMEARAIVTDDRTLAAAARSKDVSQAADHAWPARTPESALSALLTDENLLTQAAEGVLSSEEQEALRARRPRRTAASGRWSRADLALLDELRAVLGREVATVRHLLIDDAEQLTPMEHRALARRCGGTFTVLGDLGSAPGAWDGLAGRLGISGAHQLGELG